MKDVIKFLKKNGYKKLEHPLKKLAENMKDIEPEFQQAVNKNWDKLTEPSEPENSAQEDGTNVIKIMAELNEAIYKFQKNKQLSQA